MTCLEVKLVIIYDEDDDNRIVSLASTEPMTLGTVAILNRAMREYLDGKLEEDNSKE